MEMLIALAALVGLGLWLVVRPRRRPAEPEDDVDSPIDRARLDEAEREVRDQPGAQPFDATEDDDDWGPGAPR